MKIAEIIGIKEPTVYKTSTCEPDLTCAYPDLVVGVELETENCPQRQTWYRDYLSKLWQTETDGSLRGNAFEFISKPAEVRILIPELKKFFEITGFNDRNYTDRCSIHVHTNITDMTIEQVATLCLIYSIMEEPIFEFVNRFKAKDEYGYSRDTNIYCVPWAQCLMNHNVVKNMFNDVNYAFRAWQKYTAVNLLPARTIGTLEWRHMHGTADMEKITQWLNIIGSLMRYSKGIEFTEARKLIKSLNDTSAYRQFYTDIFKDYLPYTDEYAKAVSIGVVNAKYAMMDLKDGDKPKAKKADPKKKVLDFIDDEDAPEDQEGQVNPVEPDMFRGQFGVGERAIAADRQAAFNQLVGAVGNDAGANPLVNPWVARVRAQEAPVAARQGAVRRGAVRPPEPQVIPVVRPPEPAQPAPAADVGRPPIYPLRRTVSRLRGDAIWTTVDRIGTVRDANGRIVEGWVPDPAVPQPHYARGINGAAFWADVERAFRPPVVPNNNERVGF